MTKPIFKGSGVALVTPFTEDGVDYQKLEELLDFQLQNGSDAIIITGTTGEASTMPDEEQLDVIRFTAEKINHRIPVIAGCGSNDTRHGVHLSYEAEKAGADALLSVTPYYNKTTQKGLIEHYSCIAKAVSVPIILYNVPGRTGMELEPTTVAELASRFDHIVGVKECTFGHVGEILRLCPDMLVYSGEDALAVPLMSLGGAGVISVIANMLPREVTDMMHACLAGDYPKAAAIQIKLLPLISALFCETSPIPIKEALNLMGMEVGRCRLPLTDMEEKNREYLKRVMQESGVIA